MKKEDIMKQIVDFLHLEDVSLPPSDDEEILMHDEFQQY